MDESKYKAIKYGEVTVYFDSNNNFHEYFGHRLKTTRFPYHKNLVKFLQENKDLKFFFTLNPEVNPFRREGKEIVINMESYINFCESIKRKTEGRARAFLGQHIKITDMNASEKEKEEFMKTNATENNILSAIRSLDESAQKRIGTALKVSQKSVEEHNESIDQEEFISKFSSFLMDEKVQNAFINNFPVVQLETLKELLSYLENNLDKSESFIQNWIDEDNYIYRKKRCMIFGLEYVDPKREGKVNEKRFDILAEQNRENHILIELKSPTAEIFDITTKGNKNSGITTEYRISKDLSRAIPQILGYKKWYQDASPEEIQALGLTSKKNVSKCIIVIGQSKGDKVWQENLVRLKESLSIEILTYTDLIDKMNNTIENLEENL